ncbi:hypothetical protein DPMN_168304 [Dreissena polymorpha]|uniref:Uncharacterized protein n=1 Tax=Dreissena polymorpha TaxID=45954 RepID=A0A9D4F2H0_DREPO|nr:hypothetical protein DPMN_168304 [Dreissena polymorpha]
MNLLTKFHEERTVNVVSREKCPAPWKPFFRANIIIFDHYSLNKPRPCGGHVFQPTGIIFEVVQDIIGMNLRTEFHEDRTIKGASRVKNASPLGSHFFQAKFHDNRIINVASRMLTRKNAPPSGGHVFQPTGIIFKLVQDIIRIYLLTKFLEDQTKNVACRVHIRRNAPTLGIQNIIETNLLSKFHEDWTINVASRE